MPLAIGVCYCPASLFTGALSANANVHTLRLASTDSEADQCCHGGVAFVKVCCEKLQAGITIKSQGELRQVIGPNRETIKVLQKLIRQNCVAWNLTHHDDFQTIFTPFEAVSRQQFSHFFGLPKCSDKRHHHLDVAQPHIQAHTPERLALHRECLIK